jgi:acetyl esterase/lipase
MSSITAVRILASLVCVASWCQAVDAPPQDPVHEYQRRLFAEMPFNDRGRLNRTGDPPERVAWPGAAASHYDVPYLGADRDRLYQVLPRHKDHPWGFSWRTRADIHIPPGDGPFPCLVLFHGGAYQEGKQRGQTKGANKGGKQRGHTT